MANTRFPSSNTNETTETSTTSTNLPFTSTLENINREMGNITKGIAAQLTSINNSYRAWIKNRDDRKREKVKEEKNNDKKRKEEQKSLKKILNNLGKDIKKSVSSFGRGIVGSISNIVSGISGMISSALSGIFGDSPIGKLLTSPLTIAVLGIYAAIKHIAKKYGFSGRSETAAQKIYEIPEEQRTKEQKEYLDLYDDYVQKKQSFEDMPREKYSDEEWEQLGWWGRAKRGWDRTKPEYYDKYDEYFVSTLKTHDKLGKVEKQLTQAEEATKRAESRSKEKATSANVAASNTNVNNNNITNNNTIINQTSSAKSNAVTNKR